MQQTLERSEEKLDLQSHLPKQSNSPHLHVFLIRIKLGGVSLDLSWEGDWTGMDCWNWKWTILSGLRQVL